MLRSFRLFAAAAVLSVAALGATTANAGGRHFHGGGFGHHHHHGHHGHWGGPRWGFGWGTANVGYYGDGGCYVKRYVNRFGELVARTVCY